MKVTNQTTATRIAEAGFKKMTADEYTIITPAFDGDGTEWFVAKNDGSATYTILVKSAGHYTCTCPFFAENAEFGVCKHCLAIHEEISIRKYEAAEEAREEARELSYEF